MNAMPSGMESYGVLTAPDTVRLERLLPGPIERLWSYLTDSQKRAAWLAGGPMELRVGGRYEHIFRNNALTEDDDPAPAHHAGHAEYARFEGEVTECAPPNRLAYIWGDGSEVRFELAPQGDRVRMVLTHTRLTDRNTMVMVSAGWHTHIGILADVLAGKKPKGFWRVFSQLEKEYDRIIPKD